MRTIRSFCALLGAALLSVAALAQDAYPSRPIRVIVPFPPGGGSDMIARTVATRLGESWKVPVTVDNRPGGNTVIAAEAAAKAAPDGYTLFVAIDSTLAMNQSLYAKLPYDPVASFAPVTLAITMPMVLAVNPQVPVRTVPELLALAKTKGGALAYAHGALPAQVAGEVFKASTGADLLAVPYKGGAPAMTDVIGGTVPVIFDALGPAMPHIKAGKVRPLAVANAKRLPQLPDVPTFAELGFKNVEASAQVGIVAPAGTPADVVNALQKQVATAINQPAVKQKLIDFGIEPVASTPAQYADLIRTETDKWHKLIKAQRISLD